MFGDKPICHIRMFIRHMWRVANGLDTAVLEGKFKFKSKCHVTGGGPGGVEALLPMSK